MYIYIYTYARSIYIDIYKYALYRYICVCTARWVGEYIDIDRRCYGRKGSKCREQGERRRERRLLAKRKSWEKTGRKKGEQSWENAKRFHFGSIKRREENSNRKRSLEDAGNENDLAISTRCTYTPTCAPSSDVLLCSTSVNALPRQDILRAFSPGIHRCVCREREKDTVTKTRSRGGREKQERFF